MKVAVVGATGLVGSALVERGVRSGRFEPIAVCHSAGNAWRLARNGLTPHLCDIRDKSAVAGMLRNVDVVVNATRGHDDVMFQGLENLLSCSKEAGVRRFIHLSSVLVYGDPPDPSAATESGVGAPVEGTYGHMKARQDDMVFAAAASGLPSVVLCPPNIGGPASYFFLGMVDALRAGRLALLDGPSSLCNLVDVENLCEAIESAMTSGETSGRRMFVTDSEMLTWDALVDAFAARLEIAGPIPRVSRERVSTEWSRQNVPPPKARLTSTIKFLGSSRAREFLREDPLLYKTESVAKSLVRRFRPHAEGKLLLELDGPAKTFRYDELERFARPFLFQQLRSVEHSSALAREKLGYEPKYSTMQSIERFCDWYRRASGLVDPEWGDLVRLALAFSERSAPA